MINWIGLRTIKTGLAVTMCMVLGDVLHLETPFFAIVAAIITMGKTVGGSVTVGKNRIIGTSIGAIVGMLCAMFMPNNPIASGLCVILLIMICNKLNIQSSISVACMVLVAIMLDMNRHDPFLYSINRLYDTSVGIIVALLINVTIFPYNSYKKVRKAFEALDTEMAFCIATLHQKNHIMNLDELREKIEAVEKGLIACEAELHTKKVYDHIKQLETQTKQIKEMYVHIEILEDLLNNKALCPKNTLEVKQTIYNYHLGLFREKYKESHLQYKEVFHLKEMEHKKTLAEYIH